ncbi:MAG: hypothetical protein ACREYE_14375 [Gammaproteobacteria bacterium]
MEERRFQGHLTIKEEEALYQLLRSLRFFGLYLLITYAIGLALLIR